MRFIINNPGRGVSVFGTAGRVNFPLVWRSAQRWLVSLRDRVLDRSATQVYIATATPGLANCGLRSCRGTDYQWRVLEHSSHPNFGPI